MYQLDNKNMSIFFPLIFIYRLL